MATTSAHHHPHHPHHPTPHGTKRRSEEEDGGPAAGPALARLEVGERSPRSPALPTLLNDPPAPSPSTPSPHPPPAPRDKRSAGGGGQAAL
eukprot:3642828-Rhodomonas_salina.1